MAVKKLSELTELTSIADGDQFLVNDVSEPSDTDKPKRVSGASLKAYVSGVSVATLELIDGLGFAPQFRLSLTSGNPVDLSLYLTNKGTVYYTPYGGNAIQLYNGSAWEVFALSELSLSLTATAGKNYDIFIDYNSGTPQMVLGTAWTNDYTRADALAYQDGRLVKSGTAAYLYVGTIRTSGSNVTEDSITKRFVYNEYNKIYKSAKGSGATQSGVSYLIGFVLGTTTWFEEILSASCTIYNATVVIEVNSTTTILFSSNSNNSALLEATIRDYGTGYVSHGVGPGSGNTGSYNATLYANLWM